MRLYRNILNHVIAILIATALIYVYQIHGDMKDLRRRVGAIENTLSNKPIAYKLPTIK